MTAVAAFLIDLQRGGGVGTSEISGTPAVHEIVAPVHEDAVRLPQLGCAVLRDCSYPVTPSISTTSPHMNKPGQILLCMVFISTSLSETPPAVTDDMQPRVYVRLAIWSLDSTFDSSILTRTKFFLELTLARDMHDTFTDLHGKFAYNLFGHLSPHLIWCHTGCPAL